MSRIDPNAIDQTLEGAIKSALKTDVWIATNLKTIEAGLRDRELSSENISEGFTPSDLPALRIKAGLDKQDEENATTGEKDITVPVAVLAICRSERLDDCLALTSQIKDHVVALLRKQCSSEHHLGIDGALVLSSSGNIDYQQEGSWFYGIAYIEARVQINVLN